ncbi:MULTISPECIES: alpha/beta fold hydrolase [unclassified Aureispira]|uniref:alpha/beta fold hydrolase n=1 Tax=unclassified Aureispira TaxID=2649989 RepID=UPI00069910A7|nr:MULTISPECIES: alpha/beta hydrolase [unclassified Aureispira]WMX14306.1 alpha/beta hydrolase [Aureispira sp. CCB-E]
MEYPIRQKGKFKYIEEGQGTEVIVLLHGLFGSMGNYGALITGLKSTYKLIVPLLPIFELPRREISMNALMEHVHEFILEEGHTSIHLVGNSLGGHIGLLMTLKDPDLVKTLTLTGSSGLFENALGDSFPRRQSYEFVKDVAQRTFYDPQVATKALIDDIFEIVNTPTKGLNIVLTAKSAMRHNLEHELHKIKTPTLLIWGKNDTITPAFVGEDFNQKIEGSELHILDQCGHAPMMEKPEAFIHLLSTFLARHPIV